MNANEIKKLILDPSVPDDDVYQAIKKFTADRYTESRKLVPMSKSELREIVELGELARMKRLDVVRRIEKEFLAEHGDCRAHTPTS